MKRVLKIIAAILILAIVFLLIAGIFVPKSYHLEQDITINASREKIWSHVNSLQQLEKWSPWAEKDPAMKVTFEGQEGTVGSVYKWEGNKDVGEGTQTITGVEPARNLKTHLHFIEPFEGEADAFIKLADASNATKVTWGFDTRYSYPMNVMQLFVNMDEMMGKEYRAGLTKLKQICESN